MRYNGRHMSPPQILGTHESDSTPNGISIGSAVFAQLSRVSNTSVAIGRIQAQRARDGAKKSHRMHNGINYVGRMLLN